MLANQYMKYSMSYGLLHSVFNLWNREGYYHEANHQHPIRKQLVFVDKLTLGVLLTSYSPAFWPFYAMHDLTTFKIIKTQKDSPHLILK